MVGGHTRTDWLAILKKEGGAPTEKTAREQERSSRKPETIKVQKVHKAPTPRKTRASHKKMATLTAEEAFEEMANPRSGPGIQARHYRDGRITRADAIEWIACAIIYRRWGKDASFAGWRRHRKAVEEALDRFCGGGT
jgi:hypothetical protein